MSNRILLNNDYAPGLVTYGVKGGDGSSGIPGKSFYYTSLNRNIESDYITIKSKIEKNEVLSNNINVSLGDRTYNDGDLILDANGIIYKINFDSSFSDSSLYMMGKINQSEYFAESGITFDENNINKSRIINAGNIYIDYINTQSTSKQDASTYIYNGSIKVNSNNIPFTSFTHINYSDISINNVYPLELYTSGRSQNADLALVYDPMIRSFSLKSESYILLDSPNVLALNNNTIYNNSSLGNVITTNDIPSINLFNSQLNDFTDDMFNVTTASTQMTINYDISKLFKNVTDINTKNIIVNLNINKAYDENDINSLDSHNLQNIVLRNLKIDGPNKITVTNLLESTSYNVFLSLIQNGWEVKLPSKIRTTSDSISPEIMWNTSSMEIDANGGIITLEGSFTLTTEINSINDIEILTQVDGFNTQLEYITITKGSFTPATSDNPIGTFTVDVNCGTNINSFMNTNSRSFSLVARKVGNNNIYSMPINLKQSGNTIMGLFVSKWNIPSADTSIVLPIIFQSRYENEGDSIASIQIDQQKLIIDCEIDWGDGSSTSKIVYDGISNVPNNTSIMSMTSHKYSTPGTYTIKIGGKQLGGWSFRERPNSAQNIVAVTDWSLNISYIRGMFDGCKLLTEVPAQNINVIFKSGNKDIVPSASFMFNGCTNLLKNNFDNLFTDAIFNKILYGSYMFQSSGISLSYTNLTRFLGKFSNILYTNSMFQYCNNIRIENYINLPDLIPRNSPLLVSIESMYSGCSYIKGTLYFGYDGKGGSTFQIGYGKNVDASTKKYRLKSAKWFFSNTGVKGNISAPLFVDCNSLETCEGMFTWTAINSINESPWENCFAMWNTGYMFYACTNLTNVSNKLFTGTMGNRYGILSRTKNGTNYIQIPFADAATAVDASINAKNLEISPKGPWPKNSYTYTGSSVSQVCNTRKMFCYCENLTNVDDNLIKDMPSLARTVIFERNSMDPYHNDGETIDNTYHGEIDNMFAGCTALKNIPITTTGTGLGLWGYPYWELNKQDSRYCGIFTPEGAGDYMSPSVFAGSSNLTNYGSIPNAWKSVIWYT